MLTRHHVVIQSIVASRTLSALRISPAVLNLPGSGIRDIMNRAWEMDRLSPSHPVVHLEVGQPNFSTPPHIIKATINALNDGMTAYSPNNGIIPLRHAISDRFTKEGFFTEIQQIVATVGSSLSIYSILKAILQPGDQCLLPLPGYPNYQAAVAMIGAQSVPYYCAAENGYLPTMQDIVDQYTPNTRCIVICNPGNPTGASYPKELLRSIIHWAHAKGIFVISDGKNYVGIALISICTAALCPCSPDYFSDTD